MTWQEALRLSTAVLTVEPTQPKALYRRASARLGRSRQSAARDAGCPPSEGICEGTCEGTCTGFCEGSAQTSASQRGSAEEGRGGEEVSDRPEPTIGLCPGVSPGVSPGVAATPSHSLTHARIHSPARSLAQLLAYLPAYLLIYSHTYSGGAAVGSHRPRDSAALSAAEWSGPQAAGESMKQENGS